MNNSISQTHGKVISREDETRLTTLERLLLLLPTAGGLVFGVLPLLLGGAFGAALGYPGNDSFIYRLAGAATLGYAVALILGLRQGDWAPLRIVVIGTLTFNLASIYACLVQLMAGDTNLYVYLIFGTSIAITGITLWLLNRHASEAQTGADVSAWYIRFLVLGAVLSGAFGLLPLLIPVLGATLTAFQGTDVFLIRQGGATSLGYAVMSIVGMRSGKWDEIRLPLIMALTFNGFSFLASVIALFSGEPVLISVVVGAASLFVTIVGTIAYRRNGKL
jgi:hypothetical protein